MNCYDVCSEIQKFVFWLVTVQSGNTKRQAVRVVRRPVFGVFLCLESKGDAVLWWFIKFSIIIS